MKLLKYLLLSTSLLVAVPPAKAELTSTSDMLINEFMGKIINNTNTVNLLYEYKKVSEIDFEKEIIYLKHEKDNKFVDKIKKDFTIKRNVHFAIIKYYDLLITNNSNLICLKILDTNNKEHFVILNFVK